MLSDRQNESDNNLSTNMAGNTSASMSTFPEKESDQSETSMRVDSKTRHKRELSVDKIPTGFGASKNKKNRSERVVVHVRMRPFSKNELEKSKKSAIARFDTDTNLVSIYKDKAEGVKSKFYFDSLFHDNATQEEVYEVSGRRVVDSVINGFNGTIFAYGQTGTGKTFTMLGDYLAKGSDKIDQGIIPRSLSHVFEEWESQADEFSFEVSISFIQIYMEMVQDLLEPKNTETRIREDLINGVYVSGVLWVPVKNVQQSMKVFSLGEKNRSTSFTKLNAHSSRSHAVLMVKIERRKKLTEKQMQKCRGEKFEYMTSSTLFLVDLAGSERVKNSKAMNKRLDEAKTINFSLSALGNCIHALTEKNNSHVPFRDSKLTRLLQDSLGGNSKTSMIVTISPSYINRSESIMSLKFGSRAMKVQNKPSVNKKIDYKMLWMQLQEEIDAKTDQIASLDIKLEEAVKKWPKCSKLPEDTDADTEREDTEDEEGKDYKQMYIRKEKENQQFLQRIDAIIAEQEEELNKIHQDNKNKDSIINDLKESLEDAKRDIEEKDERLIEMSSEKEDHISSLKSTHLEEMDSLKSKMKKLKKQWEADVMEQVKQLETNWKIELSTTNAANAEVKADYEKKLAEINQKLSECENKATEASDLKDQSEHKLEQAIATLKTIQAESGK